MMYQILHFSDLHLEIPFKSTRLPPSFGTWRRQDLRTTLGRILTIARERKVDAITIAGDLFEQDYIMPEIAGFLSTQFGKVNPIRVIIAPGEKDLYTTESIYSLNRWPENVTIFKQSRLTKINLRADITLWGAACPPAREQNMFENLSIDKSHINLLLLHAHCSDQNLSNQKIVYSLNSRNVLDAGFNFALLGSSHQTEAIPDHPAVCAFPGSPEPFDFESENDEHHVVLLKIQDGKCVYEFLPVNRWRYLTQFLDITGYKSEARVISSIEKIIQKSSTKDDEQRVIRITLRGDPEVELNYEEIISQVKTKTLLEILVDIPVQYDLDMLAQEPTVRGTLVNHYLEHGKTITNDQERNKDLNALKCALQALEGKQIRMP